MKLTKIRYAIVYNWRNRVNSIIEKPIHIRAKQGKTPLYIETEISIGPEHWDENNKLIINHPLSDVWNKKIYDLLFDIQAFENRIIRESKGKPFPIGRLKRYDPTTGQEQMSFNQYCKEELEDSTDTDSTKKSHKLHLKTFFEKFNEGKEIYFTDITVRLIKKYDRYLIGLESINSQNTVHGYQKTIKAYINKAIDDKYLKENPYDSYKVKREREENIKRVWLSLDEVRRIEQLEILNNHSLQRAKDFILVCLWCGFRFVNACGIAPEHIKQTKEGLVIMKVKAEKANKRIFMPLYLLGKKNNNGLTKPEQLFTDLLNNREKEVGKNQNFDTIPFFNNTLQHYNQELKIIAQLAKIKKKMTTHIGRRTFANIMHKDFGLPLEMVQQLLQHSDIRTTMKYINKGDEELIKELRKADIKF